MANAQSTTDNNAPAAAPQDLPKHYDAHAAYTAYYDAWEKAGRFVGNPEKDGEPYSIVIPPPNVTGSLHMGHALNNTLQDVLIRYHRMDGYNAVWIPGSDHASIAVHWVLDRKLREEGTNRFELGREKFLERAWAFKEEAQSNIFGQLRALGVSCDWSRTRFTMDDGLSRAVRDVFVRLYRDGLIYRAERLINWDPVAQTTVSDLEVIHEEGAAAELWSFAYPLSDGSGEIVVATTRPETVLGDTAVAVHPEDPRYKHLIGKTVQHPLVDRQIPIVGDAILVDPEFGTGAVKITPAHDFNDFDVGQRHKLPMINILNADGTLNAECGDFEGLDRFDARDAVKTKIDALGLARGSQDHTMNIGRSERSGTIVEPWLSTQWFVRAKPLAAPALAAVENGFTRFVPEHWANTYYSWLRDIRDWCISRQLWWGHRVPAWHCRDCHEVTVAVDAPEHCEHCESRALEQDDDILDTWFSSALWPFSTMGWPEKTADLARWYPTAVLTTGFDIIFFWVARMMMFGQYFMGKVPFSDVYIHALIRDAQGEKMSKTKGNVIDPLDMIERYGCDAFRFTMVAFAAQGRDIRWDESRAAGYGKFINKIWQAFRFAMSHRPTETPVEEADYTVYDRWIIHRLGERIAECRQALDNYRFNDAAGCIYSFVWDEFCDWYLELAKISLYGDAPEAERNAARATLHRVFDVVARLMHPMMPFLSEELWQRLPHTSGSIMDASFPRSEECTSDADAAREVGFIKASLTAVRRVRAEFNVPTKTPVQVLTKASAEQSHWLKTHAPALSQLAGATAESLAADAARPATAATELVEGAELLLPLEGLIDFEAETARLTRELKKTQKDIEKLASQLQNKRFLDRAPDDIVADKRAQQAAAAEKASRLQSAIDQLTVG